MKENQRCDKEYTEGIAVKGGFLGWLDNYWYHYKWITIGVAFFLIVGIICTVQACTKEDDDLIVLYAGRNQLSADEAEEVCKVLEAVCPEDFDKNGEKQIPMSHYCILSEEQIKERQSETDENGEAPFIDNNYNSNQYDTYYSYIMTGESSVLLLDPWLYNSLVAGDRLVSLEEAFGYVPEGACGEYGITLGETALYEQYGVMKLIPEDTVICLLRPYVAGKSSKEDYYAREQQMFEALVTFGKED